MKIIFFEPFPSTYQEIILAFLKKEFSKKFGINLKEIIYETAPEGSWNKERKQYSSEKILDHLIKKHRFSFFSFIDSDLYVEGLNFVFGVAIPFRGFILSTFRLKGELFLSRLKKEIYHEFGHVCGLSHCKPPCVMSFSNSIKEVDRKSEFYCEKCLRKLLKNIALMKKYSIL